MHFWGEFNQILQNRVQGFANFWHFCAFFRFLGVIFSDHEALIRSLELKLVQFMYQNKGIKGSGGPQHKGSIHAAHPAVAGLNLTTHEISVRFVLQLSKLLLSNK